MDLRSGLSGSVVTFLLSGLTGENKYRTVDGGRRPVSVTDGIFQDFLHKVDPTVLCNGVGI